MFRAFRYCTLFFAFLLLSISGYTQLKSAKRGLAYGNHSPEDLNALKAGVGWWYNWYHQPESPVLASYQNYDFEFVPMAWNGAFDKEALRAFVADHPNVKYLLGWNEPNFLEQANMKPSEAAARWKDLEEIADEFGLELVSPAVNYCGDCVSENGTTYNDPVVYLDDFFAACPDCRVDHIAIHSYMGNVAALQWFVGLFKKYGKPIWLTEFANWENNPTLAQQKSFMIGAVDYLENDPDVMRYAWFTGRHTGAPFIGVLEDGQSGKLNELGQIYVNMPVHDPDHHMAIPARIEAEQYNAMSGILLEATADETGFANVGYIDKDDWLTYGVHVPEAGSYQLSLRIASTAQASIQFLVDGEALKSVALPNTTGWQTWQTVKTEVDLPAGQHMVQLKGETAGFNINWFELGDVVIASVDERREAQLAYPNPVTDKLKFKAFENIRDVTMVNALGMRFPLEVLDGEADVAFLPAGFYVLMVELRNGKVETEKLLKR